MLQLPGDVRPQLLEQLSREPPSKSCTLAERNRRAEVILDAQPVTLAGNIHAFIEWMEALREHPLAEAIDVELLRVHGRLLGVFAGAFVDVQSAITDLSAEDLKVPSRRQISRENREEERASVKEWIALAGVVGPAAVIDGLIAIGLVPQSRRAALTAILTQYLGKGTPSESASSSILPLDPEILESPKILDFLVHVFEIHVFRALLAQGANARDFRDPQACGEHLAWVRTVAQNCLDAAWDEAGIARTSHKKLRDRIVETFEAIATLPIPACFRTAIKTHEGRLSPFPSFTQRFAIQRLLDRNDQVVCLDTGSGKTAVPIVAWMIRRLQAERPEDYRFVGVYPPNMTCEVANRLVRQPGKPEVERYFLDGHAPTIGVITSEKTDSERAVALDADMVCIADTMLIQLCGKVPMIDTLVAQCRDECTIDETQRCAGGKKIAQQAARLIEVSKAASGTTATPTYAGHLRGLSMIIALFLRSKTAAQRWENNTRTSARPVVDTSLEEFRASIRQMLCMPEEPSRWLERMRSVAWTPNPDEVRVQRRVSQDRDLSFPERHVMAEIGLIAPWLFAGGERNHDPTLLTAVIEDIKRLVEDPRQHACLLATDWLSSGVYKRHDDHPSKQSFLERLNQWVDLYNESSPRRPIELHSTFGETRQEDRDRRYQAGRTAKARNVFNVHLAQRECVGTGIEMNYLTDIRHVGHPTSLRPLQQLIGRNRKKTASLAVYFARNTVQAGKRHIAYRRDEEERVVLSPDTPMSDADFRRLYEEEAQTPEALATHGRLREYLEHPDERHQRIRAQLHGRGVTYVRRALGRNTLYADWRSAVDNRDRSSSGDASRFLSAYVLDSLQKSPSRATGPIVTFGLGDMFLTEDLRRLDPQGEHRIIECAAHARTAQYALERVPASTGGVDSLQCIVQAPELVGYLRNHSNQATIPEDQRLRWRSARHVVMSGLEWYGWSADEPVADRTDRHVARGKALTYACRLLMDGGRLTLYIPADCCTHLEFSRLCTEVLPVLGITVSHERSGVIRSDDNVENLQAQPPFTGFVVNGLCAIDAERQGSTLTWKHVRTQLAPDALILTPFNQQTKAQQQALPQRGSLPEVLVHRHFTVQARDHRSSPSYTYAFNLPHRGTQEKKLSRLLAAVRTIRALAPTVDAWNANQQQHIGALMAQGIEFDGGERQPRFVLADDAEAVLRPYDEIWDAGMKPPV